MNSLKDCDRTDCSLQRKKCVFIDLIGGQQSTVSGKLVWQTLAGSGYRITGVSRTHFQHALGVPRRRTASSEPLFLSIAKVLLIRRKSILHAIRNADLIIIFGPDHRDLEQIFRLVVALELRRPIDALMQIIFCEPPHTTTRERCHSFASRLRNGSPVRQIRFYAPDVTTSAAWEDLLALSVCPLPNVALEADALAVLPPSSHVKPLICDRLGPVAVLVTALWGRTGSTMIFDAQMKVLIDNGYFVIRAFVTHYPQDRSEEDIEDALEENLRTGCALYFVVNRLNDRQLRSQMQHDALYLRSSPLRRYILSFENTRCGDRKLEEWARKRASVVIVNHLFHLGYAKKQFGGSYMVLEAHDVMTHLLDIHGIPGFVLPGPDSKIMRMKEEAESLKQADLCVALSPDDYGLMRRFCRQTRLVRPYVKEATLRARSWAEVVRANGLDERFLEHRSFDLMLWGDWHRGNIDSVTGFLEDASAATDAIEKLTKVVVGQVGLCLPDSLRKRQDILVTGAVDILDDFFLRSKLLVIADIRGTGMSVKMMECCAKSLPFVSTSAGLRGLDLSGTDVVGAEDFSELADQIIGLVHNPAAIAARTRDARRLYENNFSEMRYVRSWSEIFAGVPAHSARV